MQLGVRGVSKGLEKLAPCWLRCSNHRKLSNDNAAWLKKILKHWKTCQEWKDGEKTTTSQMQASSSSASSNDGLLRSESTCTHELIPSRLKRCASYQTTAKPRITDLSVKCNWLRTHSLRHYRGDECAVIDRRRWIGTEKKHFWPINDITKQQKLHTSLWIPDVTGDKFIERKSMIPLRQLLLDFERSSPKLNVVWLISTNKNRWTSRENPWGLTCNLIFQHLKGYSFQKPSLSVSMLNFRGVVSRKDPR